MEENFDSLPRRRFLMLSAASGMAGLLTLVTAGCGSGSGSAPLVASGGGGNLTITPTRVAPGNVVTISGVGPIPDGATFSVLFGDQPAVVRGFTPDGTGLQVVVPPFLDRTAVGDAIFKHRPPGAPVSVTVQTVGANGAPLSAVARAQNPVSVEDLPPSPGAAAATVQAMSVLTDVLSGVFTDGLLSVAADVDPGNTDPTLRYGAAQGASYVAGVRYLLSGADNPNSLIAVLNGTAPLAPGAAASPNLMALTDAMAAQSGTTQRVNAFLSDIADIVQQVAPEALISRGEHVTRLTGGDIVNGIINSLPRVRGIKIDWNLMTPVTRYITAMYIQRKLKVFINSDGLTAAELFIGAAAPAIAAAKFAALALGPGAVPAEAVINFLDAAFYIEGVASKLLSFVVTLMPAQVADFYVLVNNKNRAFNSVPIEIPLGKLTPLKLQFAPTSTGGASITVAGFILLVLDSLARGVPGIKAYLETTGKPGRAIFVNYLVGSVGGILDFVFKAVVGSPPPGEYSFKNGVNLPAIKYPVVDINDNKFVEVTTSSTVFLFAGADPNNHTRISYILLGKKATTNDKEAGFRAKLSDFRPNPTLPTLAEMAKPDLKLGIKDDHREVAGIVRVKGLDANPVIR